MRKWEESFYFLGQEMKEQVRGFTLTQGFTETQDELSEVKTLFLSPSYMGKPSLC